MKPYDELERYVGPDQLPEAESSSSRCLAIVGIGVVVLAFLAGLALGLAIRS